MIFTSLSKTQHGITQIVIRREKTVNLKYDNMKDTVVLKIHKPIGHDPVLEFLYYNLEKLYGSRTN